jgi:pSer/pThr/pTyr-binding forkhead associated (FHA) protein
MHDETQEHRPAASLSPRARRNATTSVPKLAPGRYLAIEDGDDVVVVELRQGVTRIGRGLSADVRLESPAVSRRHAMIVVEGDEVVLADDRSRNGTWLNDERITRAVVHADDVILIGPSRMQLVEVVEPVPA